MEVPTPRSLFQIFLNDAVIGVIDLDSYEFDRYSELEQNALEKDCPDALQRL